MIFNWLKPKKAPVPVSYIANDCEGSILREIDDVELLTSVSTDEIPEEIIAFRGTLPKGSVGTIINIYPHADQMLLNLEFAVDDKLAFAHLLPTDVRLYRRREEKLKRNA